MPLPSLGRVIFPSNASIVMLAGSATQSSQLGRSEAYEQGHGRSKEGGSQFRYEGETHVESQVLFIHPIHTEIDIVLCGVEH